MSRTFSSSLFLLLTLAVVSIAKTTKLSRDDFPPNFLFGSGTSAYQVEGAAAEDGRTPCIWDTFTHAGGMADKSTGDIACNQYHKYKEDVQLMVDLGLDAYRFSISWSRLIPNGRGPINPKGLEFYNNLINELLKNGIQPYVTLSHYDLPQTFEDEYGGWLSEKIVKDFTVYADVCFRKFGDRVSYWTTLNEPNSLAIASYDVGMLPPKRCSSPFGTNCKLGNSTSEPYIVIHNSLLAHASAARLYKEKYQAKQQGFIGMNVYTYWFIPLTNATEDVRATKRALDFYVGWLINPLVFGDYPEIMKKKAGSRIPSFTPQESKQVKGSYDFIGLNHYTTMYIKDNPNNLEKDHRDFLADAAMQQSFLNHSVSTGLKENPDYPSGLQSLLEYLKLVYGNPPIHIQENGQCIAHNALLNDTPRVKYMDGYIRSMLNAMRNGADVRGYFTWSFLDLFELLDGHKTSYGLYYVDFNDPDLKRHPKLSAHWYSNFLKGRGINITSSLELKKSFPRTSHFAM